jgi:sulfate permease, SulP family
MTARSASVLAHMSAVRLGEAINWQRYLPFLRWRQRVTSASLRDDLVAGLTGALVVLPQGVAFATIAGMPPEYGLYAGMVPAIIAALFGSSWHLVSGPTTAASVVLFSVLSVHAAPGSASYIGLAMALTFFVGVVQLAMGVARLGSLVNFISHAVVIGFTAGAALLIGANQIGNFFGIRTVGAEGFFGMLEALFAQLDAINPYVLTVSATTLLVGIATRNWLPRVPYMITAMGAGTVMAAVLNMQVGQAVTGISTVGALPASLPPLAMPPLSLDALRGFGGGVLAVALLTLTEAVSIARSMALKTGQALDGNQEFIGQGLSNLIGSFFSGYVATGSFNRSAVNIDAGAKTPLAAVMGAFLLMALVLLLAPLAIWLPNAAMAGVLFLVAWSLIDFTHIRQILRASRSQSLILVSTFVTALLFSLEQSIMLGVLLSFAFYLRRTSRPAILARIPDPDSPRRKFINVSAGAMECPQLRIMRIDGSLYFGSTGHLEEQLACEGEQAHLAIVGDGINFIDMDAAEFIVNEAERRRAAGGGLYFIRLKKAVRVSLRRGGYLQRLGRDAIFESKSEAIASIYRRLDIDRCKRCSLHVFNECHGAQQPLSGNSFPLRLATVAGA